MKTFITLSLMLLCAFAALAADPNEKAIQDAEKAWAAAVAAKDFNALNAMLADNLIYAHSTGNVESKQVYLGNMKKGTQVYSSITHESTKVVSYGNTAVAHSNVSMKGTNAQGPFDNHLMMMHFWVKQGGKWMLAAHQTTKLPN